MMVLLKVETKWNNTMAQHRGGLHPEMMAAMSKGSSSRAACNYPSARGGQFGWDDQ